MTVNPVNTLSDDEIQRLVAGGSSAPPKPKPLSSSGRSGAGSSYLTDAKRDGNGVFLLLLINLLVFAADHLLHWPGMQKLYLYHFKPHWWQFISCCFCHASWQHLSSNLFSLYVFGRIVEEEEGWFGVWLTYLVCGVGGAVASYLTSMGQPVVSLGASGAIFGLFAVGVLTKMSFNIRKLVEAFVLGQFVVQQLLQEVAQQAAVMAGRNASGVSHIAHLGGAAVGVLLVWLLSRLPEPKE